MLLSFSPDRGLLVVYCGTGVTLLCMYDANTGEYLNESKQLHFHGVKVFDASSDGREVYINQGIYNLVGPSNKDTAPTTKLTDLDSKIVDPKHTYYLDNEDRWIVDYKRRRVCRLPLLVGWAQLRAWGDKVVIGDGSGQVLILHLRPLNDEKREQAQGKFPESHFVQSLIIPQM